MLTGHSQVDGKDKKPTVINSKTTVLYSNDFGDPSEWSFHNASSNGTDWDITTNQSAAPIPFFQPAGFSTSANGFAIIDSDAQGSSVNQDCTVELNTLISVCTNEPYVLLRFHQMLRRFNDTTSVEVSNDGANWTEFLCNQNVDNNDNTPNPEKIDINISTVAGNQDTVYIRFRYRASDAWFWAVDDIEILRQNEYDLEGMGTVFGSTGNWNKRMPYYQIPISQIAPISITGRVKNAGYEPQLDIIITSTDGLAYNSSSAFETLGGNQSGTLEILNDWTPNSTLGFKTISTVASSSQLEGDITNDQLDDFTLEVSPKYYARSTDVRTGRVSNNFYQFGYEAGNIFDMFSDATITSAMVHVTSESTDGAPLFARLYEAVDSVTFNLLSISDTILIPSLSNDSVFRVRLITPTLLEAGKSYLLTAGSTGSPTFPGLVMGTSNDAEIFTSFFLSENSTTWFNFLETPMVKMSFESVVDISTESIEELKMEVFPNPTSGIITVKTVAAKNEKLQFEVYTTTGKLMRSLKPTINSQVQTVNLSFLPNGTYFLNVKGSSSRVVKKIIVLK